MSFADSFADGGNAWFRMRLAFGLFLNLAALLCLLPGGAFAKGEAKTSIVGGEPAAIDSLPWLAFIQDRISPEEIRYCTGTVVAPRVILTAGHCVENAEAGGLNPPSGYTVATGVADVRTATSANVTDVSQSVVYPGFDPGHAYGDAGLLILSRPVSSPAIRLADASDAARLAPGTGITIAGWGKTNGASRSGSPVLEAAETVIQSASYCQRHVGDYYPFFSAVGQFCGIDPPSYATATCHGDSGGPAIALDPTSAPVQVGITSLGEPECSTLEPNVFTRVDMISSWVGSWIAAVERGDPAPAATVPKVNLPFLSIARAKALAFQALSEELGYRWRRGRGKRVGCERIEREKVKCGISWWQGPDDYWGTITIYYLQENGAVYWNDRYKLHWVNDNCWWHSGHRQTCAIHTVHR